MQKPKSLIVINLFSILQHALIELLHSLNLKDWNRKVFEVWTVKDLAAHLLADDLGLLSRKRDGHSYLPLKDGLQDL